MDPVDPRAFRRVAGQFASGVTVVATDVDGDIRAMTASSFTSLSLDPPLVLFCAGKSTKTGQIIQSAAGFSISVLGHDQEALSTYFAGQGTRVDAPRFQFVPWTGGPRLDGCVAALGCAIESIVVGGDHWIVIGRVGALYLDADARDPLLVHAGRYARLTRTHGDEAPDLQTTSPLVLAYYEPGRRD